MDWKILKAAIAVSSAFGVSYAAESTPSDFVWSNVSMGGGGFVSAVVPSLIEQNVFYARTDVGGAYRWNETEARWESMMDWVDFSELGLLGIDAIAVDPTTKGAVYMMAGTSYFSSGRSAFLRSKDYGKSWEVLYTWDEDGAKGTKVTRFGMHGNGMGRGNGEALAVDPNDSKNMFFGTRNKGLWKSTDNGTNWEHVAAWTSAAGSDTTWNGSGFSFVQYAPGSSSVLYAGFLREGTTTNGTFENVFTSADGGATWKAMPIPDALRKTAGGSIVRLMPQRAVVAKDGSFLAVTFSDGAGPHSMGWDEGWGPIWDGFGRGAVLKCDLKTGTWTDISPEDFIDGDKGDAKYDVTDYSKLDSYEYISPYGGISINPNDPNEMVVTTEGYTGPQFWYSEDSEGKGSWKDEWGANIYHTTDGGATWISSFKYYWMDGGFYPTTKQMDENGVPWMHNGSIHWAGSVAIDPFNHERVFVTSGNGVFRTDNMSDYVYKAPENSWSSAELTQSQVWHFNAHGIEETVPYEVVSIPGGPLITVTADYDGFRHDDIAKFPQHRHLTNVSGSNVSLGSTWGLAYAPKTGKLVKVTDTRVYKGKDNSVPVDPVQYSADSGKTWTVATYGSLDETLKGGTAAISADGAVTVWVPGNSGAAVYYNTNSSWNKSTGIDNSSFVVGDPENASVFYAYNRSTGDFYQSTDAGASFAKVSSPGISNDKKFRAVPGKEGDLWLPIAERDDKGNPKGGSLKHSTDGGKTWADVSGIGYCEAVGYGVSKTGKDYPAIYAFGIVDGVLGVFGSDDQGATWTRVNDDGHEYGGLANGEFVMGDMNTYGVVYMSTAGRGVAARVPSSWKMGTSVSGGETGEITITPADTTSSKINSKFSSTAQVAYRHGNLELQLEAANARVMVFDMQGKMMYVKYFSNNASIPLKSIVPAKGSYIVQVNNGKKILFNSKVIVTK